MWGWQRKRYSHSHGSHPTEAVITGQDKVSSTAIQEGRTPFTHAHEEAPPIISRQRKTNQVKSSYLSFIDPRFEDVRILISLALGATPPHLVVRFAASQHRTRYHATHTPTYHRADQQSPNILVARNAAPTLENYDINTRHLRGNRRRRKIWSFPPSAHTHPRHCALFMC